MAAARCNRQFLPGMIERKSGAARLMAYELAAMIAGVGFSKPASAPYESIRLVGEHCVPSYRLSGAMNSSP